MNDLHIPKAFFWSGWYTNKPDSCDFIFLYATKEAVAKNDISAMKMKRWVCTKETFDSILAQACSEIAEIKKDNSAWPLHPGFTSDDGFMGYTVFHLGDESNG